MNKNETMTTIAARITEFVRDFGRRKDITITYERPTEETIGKFNEFQIRYHHIIPNEEYFMIYEEPKFDNGLLYVVNVSCESPMFATSNLMKVIGTKF